MFQRQNYCNRTLASTAVARWLAASLSEALAEQPRATLVVSGGTTPVDCLQILARTRLDWHRVDVLLSDERDVAEDHPDRNANMVRASLLQDNAIVANLLPLTPAAIAGQMNPFAAVLLGMGADGHFASIFPDADNLKRALDVSGGRGCLTVATKSSSHQRTTLTLAALIHSRRIALLAFGAKKDRVLQQPEGLPVAQLLVQEQVQVFWAL